MKFIIPPSQKQNNQLFQYNREKGVFNPTNQNETDNIDNVIISYNPHEDSRQVKLWKCDPSFNSQNFWPKCSCVNKTKPHYKLFVYIDNQDDELHKKYKNNFSVMREKVDKYLHQNSKDCIDAGIDVFTYEALLSVAGEKCKVKTGLRCAMYFDDGTGDLMPSGFYMYPRSSTGSSTPLRLANSVGIIDAGYRGELMGFFDNRGPSESQYTIEKYQRLLQICSPNLTYPIYPELVETMEMLDKFSGSNERGTGGFGSTGV
jgi:dUTP pyrophosphatase